MFYVPQKKQNTHTHTHTHKHTHTIFLGQKRERYILKSVGLRRDLYVFRIYSSISFLHTCFQLVVFVREHILHKSLLIAHSMRIECTRVYSLNGFQLVITLYGVYSYLFLSLFSYKKQFFSHHIYYPILVVVNFNHHISNRLFPFMAFNHLSGFYFSFIMCDRNLLTETLFTSLTILILFSPHL